jgi:hypothetical protein
MDKVQKPITSQCYTPSSEPFRKPEVLVSACHFVTENVTAFSCCVPYQTNILHMTYPHFNAGTYVLYSILVESNLY